MKNKLHYILCFILLSLFIMPNVYASSLKVNEITVKDKSGTISVADLELDDDGTITSNITFNQIHDFVTFDVEIENNFNTPYALESITNNKNDYLKVEYEYGKIIQPGKKEHFNVTLKYSEELINVEEVRYNDLSLNLVFSNDEKLINPQTSNPIQLFIKVLLGLGILFITSKFLKKKYVKLFILLLLLIPFLTKAEEGNTLTINFSDIKVKGRFLQYEIVIDLGNGEYQTVNETYGTTVEELPEPEKRGYSFTKWVNQDNEEVSEDTIITGDMQLTPVYEPIQYTITYNLAGGTVTNTNPVSYNIETNTFTLNNPTKPGYTFSGWRDEDTQEIQTRVVIQQGTINNKTYTATFSVRNDTAYTVIHKKQNLNDSNYTTAETENLTGATDSQVTPQRRTYTGFTSPSGQTVTINGNGTTTVTYLYTRNTYTFTVSDRTYVTGTSNGTYKYGYSISVTAQSRAGYTFKWSDNTTSLTKSFTISSNTTLSANYTARTDTAYTVIHQQQNIDNNNYTTVATNTYYGTTGESVTPSVNSYTGFNSPSTQTKTINGDGSTTFTYQYTRKSYTLTLTDSNYITTSTPSGSYRYGKSITLTANTREGYTFTKWSDNTTGSTYTFTLTGNKTIGPVYERNKVTIMFNANGGTVSPTSKEIYQGEQIGELPTPEREDYSFVGWYTAIENGTKVETTTTFNTTTSIYAIWRGSNLLYNVLKFEAEEDGVARKYTGEHQDSMDETKCTKDIYHWYSENSTHSNQIINKNNVIFGNYCWQIYRTTDTGGVKLLYNGDVVDNKCLNTRENHIGFYDMYYSYITFYDSYHFSDQMSYDTENKTFTLTGNVITSEWNESTYRNLIGKYTCYSLEDTCDMIYYITSPYGNNYNRAYVARYKLDSKKYDIIGNSTYSADYFSLNMVGYKHGENLYDKDETYVTPPLYTTTETGTFYYSKNYIENGDGTVSLVDPSTISSTDFNNDKYSCQNVYICSNPTLSTCNINSLYFIFLRSQGLTSVRSYEDYASGKYYGNSVTWDGTKYTLVDYSYIWVTNGVNTFINNHYYCSDGSINCEEVRYEGLYVILRNGKTIESYVEDNLTGNNVNTYDSAIKKLTDMWYKQNMTDYTDYLEDTIFCNNRTLKTTSVTNPNGGKNGIYFDYGTDNKNLKCINETDKFSLSNNKAQLTYPVGLMTYPEFNLSNYYIKWGSSTFHSMSPYNFSGYGMGYQFYGDGGLRTDSLYEMYGVRPVISLAPGIKYSSGDGSMENPYVIDYNIPICKRATSLHTTTCENSSMGCKNSIGTGNTITYGNRGTAGTLASGDAFDCDVNKDGTYDAATERFYYITSDGENSILIYYTNVDGTTPVGNGITGQASGNVAYHNQNKNYLGPVTAYVKLPTTSDWSNPLIIPPEENRQIKNEAGTTTNSYDVNNYTIQPFTYTNRAARLLTYQELKAACGNTLTSNGNLDNCNFLFENVERFERNGYNGALGHWLETPRSDGGSSSMFYINGAGRFVDRDGAENTHSGVRPVITVKTSNIEY